MHGLPQNFETNAAKLKFNGMKLNILRSTAAAVFFLLLGITPMVQAQTAQENSQKFGRLLRLVESYYVDTTNLSVLTDKAIVNLLQDLDPHSVYISKEEVDRMNEPLQGNFEGIGISFSLFKDTLLVASTIPGGPSEKVGMMAGDRILVIDGRTVAGIGLSNDDVMKMLRGEKGTKVELKVLRRSALQLIDFTIVRDRIPIYSLDASYMIDKHTGYIKLNRFAATTIDEFKSAMAGLQKEGIRNLILDLRGNGGGYLTAAIQLADEFIPGNHLVVYTEGVNNPKRDYMASGKGMFEEGNLVVLVDEGSASASEIVAGAVQDWDRGVIVGRRSFGKGLVQQPFYLTDGSMVRLTTAHYYTPSGRAIQKPYEGGLSEYRRDYQRRLESGELFSADNISFPDSLKFQTKKFNRTVYGGGGIMPDIFIKLDTSARYPYYNRLQRSGTVNNFVTEYIDKNRQSILREYKDFPAFRDKFSIGEEIIENLVTAGEAAGIQRDAESLEFTRNQIKKELKSLIARDVYAQSFFYQIYNQDDQTILKALELLRHQDIFKQLMVVNERP